MKISFEMSRSVSKSGTGASLRSPLSVRGQSVQAITPDHMKAMRFVEDFNHRLQRSYDATSTDRYNADFKGTYGSANTEIFPGKYSSRARSRTLAKDTPHGKAIVRTFQNNVVGPEPFKLEMKLGSYDAAGSFTEEKELNRIIEAAWKKFL